MPLQLFDFYDTDRDGLVSMEYTRMMGRRVRVECCVTSSRVGLRGLCSAQLGVKIGKERLSKNIRGVSFGEFQEWVADQMEKFGREDSTQQVGSNLNDCTSSKQHFLMNTSVGDMEQPR